MLAGLVPQRKSDVTDGLSRVGQFCIDFRLVAALRGGVKHGLFFRGSEAVPFGPAIRPVRELIAHLLGPATLVT